MPDGTYTSSLVMSKARVAPVKAMTIPRLELMGPLLCARLVFFVHKALKRQDVSIRCWTDSMVALCWIRGSPSKWKQFVANRVCEIQDLTDPCQWFHCCGELNPADLVSRGLGAEELMSSELWMKGPELLVHPGTEPCAPVEVDGGSVLSSVSQDVADSPFVSVGFYTVNPAVLPVSRWGTLCKAIHVVAWVRRFVRNTRNSVSERVKGELSFAELEKAKMVLIQQVQCGDFPEECASLQDGRPVKKSSPLYKFQPFLDGEGIMRVGGRLQFSDLSYDSKHPILIPKSHLAVLLVRFQHQLLKHGGVNVLLTSLRNQIWIVGARALASKWRSGVCRVRSRMQLHQVNLQLLFQQCVWGLLSLLQSQVWTTLVPCIVATNLGRSCTCCCLRVVLCEQCTWSLSPFSPVLRHWWPSVGL